MKSRSGFTLIELLVVIAIIAILATVIVLVLNPMQLMQQSRDATRIADLATLNSAVSLYKVDQSGSLSYSLGNASSAYVSVPDPSSTCGDLGFLAAPSGFTYACAPDTAYRRIDATGWIPVALNQISGGSPIGSLPVDPVNQTSSGLFYGYSTNGSKFEVTALLESPKYRKQYDANPDDPGFPGVLANGMSFTISPFYNSSGLVGYWPFDEGSSTKVIDQSGNGDNGTWNGTPAGSGSYYGPGKVGNYAGAFNGSNDYVDFGNPTILPSGYSPRTLCAWGELTSIPGSWGWMAAFGTAGTGEAMFIGTNGTTLYMGGYGNDISVAGFWKAGTWNFICNVYDGATAYLYANGTLLSSAAKSWNLVHAYTYSGRQVNGGEYWPGLVDDVRIYSRALSAAEVMALYNAEK